MSTPTVQQSIRTILDHADLREDIHRDEIATQEAAIARTLHAWSMAQHPDQRDQATADLAWSITGTDTQETTR